MTAEEIEEIIEYLKSYGGQPYAGYAEHNRNNAYYLIDEIEKEWRFKRIMKTITPWEFINLTQGSIA